MMKYILTYESYNNLNSVFTSISTPYTVSTSSVLAFTDTPFSNGGDVTAGNSVIDIDKSTAGKKVERKPRTEIRKLERKLKRKKEKDLLQRHKDLVPMSNDRHRFDLDNRPTSDA